MTRTRFAPSPTGRIHLGNARTALFNALLAARDGGAFVLRLEDTDAARDRAEFAGELYEDLRWLGLGWQEGPDTGGPHAPYAQSGRDDIYARYYAQLDAAGHTYPCFCSPQELAISRKAQLAAGRPPRYAGTCAALTPAEVEQRLAAGKQPSLRFRVPDGRAIVFDDLVRGRQEFRGEDIGDFIIRRADGTPAFFFSNAVDDALMGITHALRGEDHLANTPRQLLILEALGLPAPRYGHIALVLSEQGGPLSKRAGAASIRGFRLHGYLPGALSNYLARLGHHYPDDAYRDMAGLARDFDPAHLGRAPAHFDPAQLDHWQRVAISHLRADERRAWLAKVLEKHVPADQQDAFLEAVLPNILFPYEALVWAQIIFGPAVNPAQPLRDVLRQAGKAFFAAAQTAIEQAGTDYAALTATVREATGAKGKALFQPLRIALTGRSAGPELAHLLPMLGADRAAERFAAAAALCD